MGMDYNYSSGSVYIVGVAEGQYKRWFSWRKHYAGSGALEINSAKTRRKRMRYLKVGLVVLLGVLLLCSGAFAMGDTYGGHHRRDDRGDNRRGNMEERHYYRDGRWYKRDQGGHEVTVADIVLGAIAESIPPQHQTIVIQNTPYYYDNSHYYQRRPDNTYIVVEPPRR